jgi:hypothetical protein
MSRLLRARWAVSSQSPRRIVGLDPDTGYLVSVVGEAFGQVDPVIAAEAARLMAAAPALLRACLAARKWIRLGDPERAAVVEAEIARALEAAGLEEG